MRIAMIGQKGFPAKSGGIERHVEELSTRLAQSGHDVLVFCRSWYGYPSMQKETRTPHGVRLIRVVSLHTKHLDAITHTFFSILSAARHRPDVYHIHGVGPALLSWIPRLLSPNAKVVVTFHCIDRHHQKWGAFARAMLHLGEELACRIPHATIAVSKTLASYCSLSYGKQVIVIPNGATIVQTSPSAHELENLQLTPGQYLLMCSRLIRHKGAHVLISAWKELQQTHPDLSAGMKLVLVGDGSFTDAYVEELHQLAGEDTSIVFTGVKQGEALRELFANCRALVHPSLSEGQPLVVLEAMAAGKCVLASDIPEHVEIIEGQGLTFRAGDAEDLKEKLLMMLERPDLCTAVGTEARQYVARNHDWDEIATQTEHVYEWVHAPEPLLQTVKMV